MVPSGNDPNDPHRPKKSSPGKITRRTSGAIFGRLAGEGLNPGSLFFHQTITGFPDFCQDGPSSSIFKRSPIS